MINLAQKAFFVAETLFITFPLLLELFILVTAIRFDGGDVSN
jgi:hypothetical protein